jgi:hypothetical protein
MRSVAIPPLWLTADTPALVLHPVTGAVEVATHHADGPARISAAARLLDGLLEPDPDGVRLSALDLALPVHDRALAALYRREFGPRIVLRRSCERCGLDGEAGFDLDDLESACRPSLADAERLPSGRFRAYGVEFRLPTSRDLLRAHDAASLAELCAGADVDARAQDAIDRALAHLAPRLRATVEMACHGCGAEQALPFSIDDYVLRAFERERPILWREVDVLARLYRWGLDAILGLTRTDRHRLVGLAAAAQGPAS